MELVVTPTGELDLRDPTPGSPIAEAFARSPGDGLVRLGAAEVDTALPPALAYFRDLAARYVATVCGLGEVDTTAVPPPDIATLAALAASAPPMTGGEYLTADVLASLWLALGRAFTDAARESTLSLADFLRTQHASWHLVGRVCFNLAENRRDPDAPFAFLATYTRNLSARGTAQHVPLGQALREFADARAKPQLRALLAPVRRAAESCAWLADLVHSDEIFHPLRWSPDDATRLLADAHALEAAGVVVRMPHAWGGRPPSRPEARATVGANRPSGLGGDALLDFQASLAIDGDPLTSREVADLLAGGDGLRLLRGRWIEIDRDRIREALDRVQAIGLAFEDGVSLAEAMRLVAGADITRAAATTDTAAPSPTRAVAGPWLADTLAALRVPGGLPATLPGAKLHAQLRPYQEIGLRWLQLVTQLGLGACLADDMGLGKTIQIISLLLTTRIPGPHVLVAPASLLGNWTAELERFAPSLRARVAHASAMPAGELASPTPPDLAGVDLVITSYGTISRAPWLAGVKWGLAVVDEAQAIKNPSTRQTRAVKTLGARARVALTGTPIENKLGDLWSIFDFVEPGLLGTAKQFTTYTRSLGPTGYAPLRTLIAPYVLRRLKTDRAVIADLPDKAEVTAYCALSRKQAALYQQAVEDLAARLRSADGMARRGAVLASLMRLKQICNSPAHWLGEPDWIEDDSGKLARVREIAEVIAAKQDKLLVFTQFREATAPLARFLESVFGAPGLVLSGATRVRERGELVRRFQTDPKIPFFVLTLKAGGTGLNLTAASHVLHFDRWWNPAVEDQATDRAFRIGQHRNVLVHKLVCRGTVEDKIDALIGSKRALSRELLDGTSEVKLTEMTDTELLELVKLDLGRALMDAAPAPKPQPAPKRKRATA